MEEGLLPFWSLKRIQEYDLAEMGKVFIPAHLDDLVKCNVVCRLYHNAFKRKWIGKFIRLRNVCHPVSGSEEMF